MINVSNSTPVKWQTAYTPVSTLIGRAVIDSSSSILTNTAGVTAVGGLLTSAVSSYFFPKKTAPAFPSAFVAGNSVESYTSRLLNHGETVLRTMVNAVVGSLLLGAFVSGLPTHASVALFAAAGSGIYLAVREIILSVDYFAKSHNTNAAVIAPAA